LSDAEIALKIDQYQNWKKMFNTPPTTLDGRILEGTTYEREAWMRVAVRMLIDNPWGYGLYHTAFGILVKREYLDAELTLSHSGWLDLGMSFGFIGLVLLLSSLLWTMRLAVKSSSSLGLLVYWWTITILLVFSVTEIYYYHGIEILIFWLTFLPALVNNSNRMLKGN
jgi:hypothetical protein